MTPSAVGAEIAASMTAATGALKTSIRTAMRAAGDRAVANAPKVRFRNLNGPATGARADVSDDEVTVSPTGPVGILEPGARPHLINSKRAMPLGGGIVRRGPIKHPGTKDTHKWTDAMDKTFDQVGRELPDTVGDAVESAFSG